MNSCDVAMVVLTMNGMAWIDSLHDDIIKWKHFPCYWPFVRRIHRSPVNSPHKGQWRRALMFSLICAWTNSWANHGDTGDMRYHGIHYDVTVITLDESTARRHQSRGIVSCHNILMSMMFKTMYRFFFAMHCSQPSICNLACHYQAHTGINSFLFLHASKDDVNMHCRSETVKDTLYITCLMIFFSLFLPSGFIPHSAWWHHAWIFQEHSRKLESWEGCIMTHRPVLQFTKG